MAQASAALDLARNEADRAARVDPGDRRAGQGEPLQAVLEPDRHPQPGRLPPGGDRRPPPARGRREAGQARGRPLRQPRQGQVDHPGAGRRPRDRLRPGPRGHARQPASRSARSARPWRSPRSPPPASRWTTSRPTSTRSTPASWPRSGCTPTPWPSSASPCRRSTRPPTTSSSGSRPTPPTATSTP